MQVERVTEEQRRVTDDHMLRHKSNPRRAYLVDIPGGTIFVQPTGKFCEAILSWEHEYGATVLARGTYATVNARITDVLLDGPDVPPVHEVGFERLNLVEFADDRSTRATVPRGELRFKPFLDKSIAMLVSADRSLRLCQLGEYETLASLAETYTEEWAASPRLVVFFRGKLREFRASNIAGELGMHRIDERTRLVLVPHSLDPSGESGSVALELMSGDDVELLAIVPILGKHQDLVLWSDGSVRPNGRGRAWRPQVSRQAAKVQTKTVERRPHKLDPSPLPPEAAMLPGVQELLGRYLEEVREAAGPGKSMRAELSPLQRCAEKGVRIRGRGAALRQGFEAAGEFTFRGGTRTFQNFVKGLVDDGILARPCEDGRAREFVFDELFDPDSETVARLFERYGITRGGNASAPAEDEPSTPVEGEPSATAGGEPGAPVDEPSAAVTGPTAGRVADVVNAHPGVGGPGPSAAPSPQAPSAPPPPRRDPRIEPRPLFYKPMFTWKEPDDDGDSGGGSGSA
jgi:hypothetical protein